MTDSSTEKDSVPAEAEERKDTRKPWVDPNVRSLSVRETRSGGIAGTKENGSYIT